MYAVEHCWGRIVPVVTEACDPRMANLVLGLIQHVDCTDPTSPPGSVAKGVGGVGARVTGRSTGRFANDSVYWSLSGSAIRALTQEP